MKYPSNTDLELLVSTNANQYLFHYTTYSSALGILLSGQMRLGALANMNDPLEFQDCRDEGLVFVGSRSPEDCYSDLHDFDNAVIEKQNSVRLASFSMDLADGNQNEFYNNLSKGWARSRMWAQYADNHKGVCLIFDKMNLVQSFENTFKESETRYGVVKYTNDLEPLKCALWRSCKSLLTQDKIEYLFQKCEDFRDEQEFRLLLVNKDLKNAEKIVSFSISDSICGIIPGVRFPQENELSLKNARDFCNPNIKWLPIWWSYGMPRLSDPARFKAMIEETMKTK